MSSNTYPLSLASLRREPNSPKGVSNLSDKLFTKSETFDIDREYSLMKVYMAVISC